MANEKRLVNANEFGNRLSHVVYDFFDTEPGNVAKVGYYTKTIQEVLKQTKTVDAVPVVRCGECRKYAEGHCCRPFGGGSYVPFPMKPDDFCSYGERKDNE